MDMHAKAIAMKSPTQWSLKGGSILGHFLTAMLRRSPKIQMSVNVTNAMLDFGEDQ